MLINQFLDEFQVNLVIRVCINKFVYHFNSLYEVYNILENCVSSATDRLCSIANNAGAKIHSAP
jgi:hypothetical protein